MKVFVCGGFGFAGHYLVYGLLKQGHQLLLLAREKESQSLGARVQSLIKNNKSVNAEFQIDQKLFGNITVLNGDLSAENLGLSNSDLEYLESIRIDEIHNVAACLHYEEMYRNQCWQTNVEGTRQLLELAVKKKCRYVHASTAYITGNDVQSGKLIKERFYDSKVFPNVYIESKAQAEMLIRKYGEKNGVDYLIFRLPTLIGDSQTGFTNSIFGFYEYLGALSVMQRKGNNETQIRFSASPNGTVNLLPTDIVIKCVLRICANSDFENRIFNLTDSQPISPSELAEIMGRLFGLPMVATGSHILDNGMTKTEKLFARLTRKNAAFAKHVYRFDCSNSEKHLGHTVSKEWAKTNRYFSLLKDGYEAFIAASNTKG